MEENPFIGLEKEEENPFKGLVTNAPTTESNVEFLRQFIPQFGMKAQPTFLDAVKEEFASMGRSETWLNAFDRLAQQAQDPEEAFKVALGAVPLTGLGKLISAPKRAIETARGAKAIEVAQAAKPGEPAITSILRQVTPEALPKGGITAPIKPFLSIDDMEDIVTKVETPLIIEQKAVDPKLVMNARINIEDAYSFQMRQAIPIVEKGYPSFKHISKDAALNNTIQKLIDIKKYYGDTVYEAARIESIEEALKVKYNNLPDNLTIYRGDKSGYIPSATPEVFTLNRSIAKNMAGSDGIVKSFTIHKSDIPPVNHNLSLGEAEITLSNPKQVLNRQVTKPIILPKHRAPWGGRFETRNYDVTPDYVNKQLLQDRAKQLNAQAETESAGILAQLERQTQKSQGSKITGEPDLNVTEYNKLLEENAKAIKKIELTVNPKELKTTPTLTAEADLNISNMEKLIKDQEGALDLSAILNGLRQQRI